MLEFVHIDVCHRKVFIKSKEILGTVRKFSRNKRAPTVKSNNLGFISLMSRAAAHPVPRTTSRARPVSRGNSCACLGTAFSPRVCCCCHEGCIWEKLLPPGLLYASCNDTIALQGPPKLSALPTVNPTTALRSNIAYMSRRRPITLPCNDHRLSHRHDCVRATNIHRFKQFLRNSLDWPHVIALCYHVPGSCCSSFNHRKS
jgi:hypothetical protein